MQNSRQKELEQLIVSAKNGDRSAFSKIIEMFYGMVVCYLISRGNRIQDAEDLTQETFLLCFNKINQFKNTGSFSGWLLRIARNLYIDKLRKEKGKENAVDSEIIEAWATQSETPEDIIISNEQIQEVFNRLSPKEKLLLDMRVFQRMPYSEIAEIFETSEGNVRILFHRLINRLKF